MNILKYFQLKGIFFTCELDKNGGKSTIIKIWKFDEKNKDIILLESFNFTKFSEKIISGENYFSRIEPIQGSENLFFINFLYIINKKNQIEYLLIFNIKNKN